jgi:hypothetical protein
MSAILAVEDDIQALDPSIPMVAISVRAFTDANHGELGLPAMAITFGADRGPQMPRNGDGLFQSILRCRADRESPAGRRPLPLRRIDVFCGEGVTARVAHRRRTGDTWHDVDIRGADA